MLDFGANGGMLDFRANGGMLDFRANGGMLNFGASGGKGRGLWHSDCYIFEFLFLKDLQLLDSTRKEKVLFLEKSKKF